MIFKKKLHRQGLETRFEPFVAFRAPFPSTVAGADGCDGSGGVAATAADAPDSAWWRRWWW